jgi:hypothetical protein
MRRSYPGRLACEPDLDRTSQESKCAADSGPQVVESDAEQPWAEFCRALERPALLLPITEFVDLEET